MTKKELNSLKQQAKAKGKALADAHKSKPPMAKSKTKDVDTKALKRKPKGTDIITSIIEEVLKGISADIIKLTQDMSVQDKIELIDSLQNVRDAENFHELKWGK